MKTIIYKLTQLWLFGTVLLLLVHLIQFLAGIPFSLLLWANSDLHPAMVFVVILYYPIAVAWIAGHLIRRRSIHHRCCTFLNRLSTAPSHAHPIENETDRIIIPLIYLGIYGLLNAALTLGLLQLSSVMKEIFDITLDNPEAIPSLTAFVIAFRWWPSGFFFSAMATGIALLAGRIRSRRAMHVLICMCFWESLLLAFTFLGVWMPVTSILLQLV